MDDQNKPVAPAPDRTDQSSPSPITPVELEAFIRENTLELIKVGEIDPLPTAVPQYRVQGRQSQGAPASFVTKLYPTVTEAVEAALDLLLQVADEQDLGKAVMIRYIPRAWAHKLAPHKTTLLGIEDGSLQRRLEEDHKARAEQIAEEIRRKVNEVGDALKREAHVGGLLPKCRHCHGEIRFQGNNAKPQWSHWPTGLINCYETTDSPYAEPETDSVRRPLQSIAPTTGAVIDPDFGAEYAGKGPTPVREATPDYHGITIDLRHTLMEIWFDPTTPEHTRKKIVKVLGEDYQPLLPRRC